LGCRHDFSPGNRQAILDSSPLAALTALASGSGDHAELARLKAAMSKSNDEICQSLGKALGYPWFKDDQRNFPGATEENGVCVGEHVAESIADEAASRISALLEKNAALRAERDQIAGESIWWAGVIGDGSHQPSGEVRSIKHLHPAMVKPIYEANKGTAVADVIAGLIFSLAITENREQFLVADANERRTEAERKLAEAVGLNDRAAELMRQCTDPKRFEGASTLNVYANMRAWLSDLSKEAERG